MADADVVDALIANLQKQWIEDAIKKPSITATLQYNMLVANANALKAADVLTVFGAEDVQSQVDGALTISGFNPIHDVLTAHAEDWEAGFPVDFAT